MIRNLFFILFLLFNTSVAFSQSSLSQAQKLTDNMKVDLSLTEEQATQVLPVNQSFVESLQALRTSGDRKLAKYRKFKTADDQRDKALKVILTNEQYDLFRQHKDENRAALKEARNKNRYE